MMNAKMTVAVRGRQNRRSHLGLPGFFGSNFCIKAKGGITYTRINIRKEERRLKQCFSFLRQAQDKLLRINWPSMTKQKMQTR
jgi:hypothetical protein